MIETYIIWIIVTLLNQFDLSMGSKCTWSKVDVWGIEIAYYKPKMTKS